MRDMEKQRAARRRWGARNRAYLAMRAKCDLVCANCHRLRTAKRRLG